MTSYGRNKNLDDVKLSRTSPEVHFKELSFTKQKTRPRMNYEWIAKTIKKKIRSKNRKKKQKLKAKLPHMNKKLLAKANFCSTTVYSLL